MTEKIYTIRTDAMMQDVAADTLDDAIADCDELGGAASAMELTAWIDRINDGAWCWIDDPEGRRVFEAGPQPGGHVVC